MSDRRPLVVDWDAQIFRKQRHGGISRYFSELRRGLESFTSVTVGVRLRWTDNGHLLESGALPRSPAWVRGRAGSLLDRGAGVLGLPRPTEVLAMRRPARAADLTHATYYEPPGRERSRGGTSDRRPLVSTVHDCIPERLPDQFPGGPHPGKEWYLRNSDLLLCVSESTRRDLEDLYGPLRATIRVTPLGVDLDRFTAAGPRHDVHPRPWVLFVGDRERHKDFRTMLRALATGRSGVAHLVVAGVAAVSSTESAEIQRLGLAERITFVRPADDELPRLYRGADALVVTSRYEGFGLPVLEAMACGTPVIAAATSSLPEVGGEAARYFPAGEEEALAATLAEILGDDSIRLAMGAAGIERAATFTWRRTAEGTADAYRAVAEA